MRCIIWVELLLDIFLVRLLPGIDPMLIYFSFLEGCYFSTCKAFFLDCELRLIVIMQYSLEKNL